MGPIKEALREKFFHALFREEDINTKFRKILVHSVKHCVLGLTDPQLSAESAYNTSKSASTEPVDSLLGGSTLNYVGHRACVRREVAGVRKGRKNVEFTELDIQKDIAGCQESNRLHRATHNGAFLSALYCRLNGRDLSQEEFRDDLCLIYGLMP